jgi:dTDP-4-amino-4,6-dideoxygalactose transaminase
MDTKNLAVNGGPKSIHQFSGKSQPKVGHDEFLAMARTWGYPQSVIDTMRPLLAAADLGAGPNLAGYKPDSCMRKMEERAQQLFQVKHAFPVSSGTAALHCAFMAAGLCHGDEVIVPAFTFIATAMAAAVMGAIPVWCEVDKSLTIDPVDLEKHITPRTRAIAPVHMNGYICNMDAVMDVARRHNLMVIEDCAQACGDSFKGRRVGTIGHLGCFSISHYKTTGGGEGGMVMTNDPALYARARHFSEAGGLWRPDRFASPRWEGEVFNGLNYRISELEATVSLVQLDKMDALLERKRANKRRIAQKLAMYRGVEPQVIHALDGEHGDRIGLFFENADVAHQIAKALAAEGVPCGSMAKSENRDWHFYRYMTSIMDKVPSTRDGFPWVDAKTGQPRPVEYSPAMCPASIDLMGRHVSIFVDQWWTPEDCTAVAAAVTKVLGAFFERDASHASLWDVWQAR